MKKIKESYKNEVVKKIGELISDMRTKNVQGKKYSQENFVCYLAIDNQIDISLDSLKSYEQNRRICTIRTFMEIASCTGQDLEKWKKEKLHKIENSKELKYGWEQCPADIFLSIADAFDLDLNEIKDKFKAHL